jgi:alkyl hydroperoxide reductase subunit D
MNDKFPFPQLPDYAKDLQLNLSSLLRPGGAPGLSETQVGGIVLASALASRNPAFSEEVRRYVGQRLDDATVRAAAAAAAVMAMNNVYYRFLHLVGDAEYRNLPARLRMNVLRALGVDTADLELYALAVSAVNGCGLCIQSHERSLREHGVTREGVQSAIRIAAVIHAVAVTAEQTSARREGDTAQAA